MTCSTVKLHGQPVIMCGRDRVHACGVCQAPADWLCDWKVKGGTCDVPMCDEHRHNVGEDRDLCFRHMNAWKVHPANAQGELPV